MILSIERGVICDIGNQAASCPVILDDPPTFNFMQQFFNVFCTIAGVLIGYADCSPLQSVATDFA